jgi:predicted DNA-binding transcriptional regulator AlpA
MLKSDFISIDEAAQLTGYSKQALANYRSKKEKFPFYKSGRLIKYKKSELEEIINNGRVAIQEEGK